MAITSVKTTYSLDTRTVRALDVMARRWKVSKSEALRRIIGAAAKGELAVEDDPLKALDELQRRLKLTERDAADWESVVREERASFPRRSRAKS